MISKKKIDVCQSLSATSTVLSTTSSAVGQAGTYHASMNIHEVISLQLQRNNQK